MTTLRWLLGVPAAAVAVGWGFLIAAGNAFRGSFGASPNEAWKVVVPIAAAVLFLAGAVWPDRRPLLHAVAIAALALVVGCVFLVREAPFVATLGALYGGGWLYFYYHAVWRAAAGAAPVP